MRDSFDAFDYLEHLRSHWRIPAAAIGSAIGLAIAVSLLLPNRYTATATILIDPPAANEVRTATAVSPVYLESLRSYEHFAASDKLFADAVKRFHLQDAEGKPSIESLKRKVLRVSKPRDTKILEISATLPDAKMAHDFVSFIAEQTVALNRSENIAADHELLEEARRQLTSAQERLRQVRQAAAEDAGKDAPDALSSTIDTNLDVAAKIRKELVDAEGDAADYEETGRSPDTTPAGNAAYARRQLPGAKARVTTMRKRLEEIEHTIAQQKTLLAKRLTQRGEIDADVKTAQVAFDTAAARLRDMEASAGNRGERLRIIDPGIVPQRPSSPDLVLNTIIAALAATVLSLVYVSMKFVYARRALPKLRASVRGGMSA